VTLNFIFMAGYLVRAANFIIGRGVPMVDTLYVLMLAMPGMIGYIVPTSILTAVLIVFGNLSQNNELRAIKASGIHLLQILMPVFLIGLALSFGMFVFNDQVTSNAGFQLRRTTKQMLVKHPKALIEPGRFIKLSDTVIFMTKGLQENEMKEIVAYEVEKSDKPIRTIIAERGEIATKKESGEVEIRLYDGSISDAQEKGVHTIQFKTYIFPPLGQEDIRRMEKKMRDLTLAEMLIRLNIPDISKQNRRELWTAFHQRISFACGSFIFVFIGIPIAVLVRRGEIVLSFGIAMAAASLYYILFVGAKTLSVQGVLPPFLASWAPNILLLALGSHLLKRSLAT
jgi:lipopolysaccharide export LptBFGC system permease protein LptF